MINKKATRYFSKKQEKAVANELDGKVQANSGATEYQKGDVKTKTDKFLIECKTVMTSKKSVSIKKEWLDKIEQERKLENRDLSCVAFNFEPDGELYYVLPSRSLKALLREISYLENKEN